MKLRVQNSYASSHRVILEPWASEVMLAPGESVWVVAEGDIPGDAYFDVDSDDEAIVVTPEWSRAIAYLCDANGRKLD